MDQDFDIEMFAQAIAMSRKLQQRSSVDVPVIQAIPPTSAGEFWRALIDRLNATDPEGGWGRMKIGDTEFVATKGTAEIHGGTWL